MSIGPQKTPRKTWPWILGLLVCMLVAALVPQIQDWLLEWDVSISKWFNGLLGYSETFDMLVGGLNSEAGDLILVLSFMCFFLIHSCYQWNRRDVCRKLAFWGWVSLLCILLYQSQRMLALAIDRDSPGQALQGWFDLRKVYDIKAKVANTHSFPSGHAMAFYFIAFLALRRSLRTGLIPLAVAIIVPTTQIMSGAHWASDIFLGSVPISLFIAALFYETRVRKLFYQFEYLLDGLWHIIRTRRRNLRHRLAAAWAERLSDTPRYYLPHLDKNPMVRLKHHFLYRRRPLPEAPAHIQIETVAGCNANCVFCPNKKTEAKVPLGQLMDWDLYRSLVDQSIEWGIRRISPYLNNEPLLDSELPERIKYITDRKKDFQFTKINSNGSLLTDRMAKGLLDSGLDRINFSVQGLDPQSYQELMRLPLRKTLDNIDRLLELKRSGGYKLPRIRVCMLMTKVIESQSEKILEYWGVRGVGVNFNQIENRGNHQAIQSDALATHPLQQYNWCNRLFEQMYIAYDGRALMCCADWEYRGVMGDTKKDTLQKIWTNFRYGCFRERFLTGHTQGMLCDGCTKDNSGDENED